MTEQIKVEIEKLSFGGDGIARHEGLVIFVPYSAPGDHLLVRLTEKKKNFARAEIIEIIKPGPSRTPPPCPVFGRCGGCQWQHISYEEQLHQKQLIVADQLKRVLSDPARLLPIVPSPKPFRYRNRIQLKFDGQKLGFYAQNSHEIVDINDCPITEEAIAQKIPVMKADLLSKKSKAITKIEVIRTSANLIEVVHEDSPFEGVGFSQVNSQQNENLVSSLQDWMKDISFETFYDFYAGAGNFTFPMMETFPQARFVAVELNEKSVKIAQDRVRKQNLSPQKIKFYLSDVELYLKRNPLPPSSVVLLDPPRSGCSENTVRMLAEQQVRRIFYISCNPAALARDLDRMRQVGSWIPLRVQPF
ncbi:MAG: class I SAM-dependent RNA methyltransferase, partial [Pseudobdellovibrionaceae bacterium]